MAALYLALYNKGTILTEVSNDYRLALRNILFKTFECPILMDTYIVMAGEF